MGAHDGFGDGGAESSDLRLHAMMLRFYRGVCRYAFSKDTSENLHEALNYQIITDAQVQS